MKEQTNNVYAVDFDGTLCEERYPSIGIPNYTLIEYLKKIQQNGGTLILWTCRNGELLEDAVAFAAAHGLHFDYVNENAPWMVKDFAEESRKIYATHYIDDRGVGYTWSAFQWQLRLKLWLHNRRARKRLRNLKRRLYDQYCERVDRELDQNNSKAYH